MNEQLNFDNIKKQDIKKDFNEKKLEEILESLITGDRPKGGGKDEGSYISIGGTEISSQGYIEIKDPQYIDNSFFEKISDSQLKKHDILMTKDGANSGEVAMVWENKPNVVTNEHVMTLRLKEEVNPPYIFYYLLSHKGKTQLKGVITGSAQEGINKSFPSKIDIKYPSLLEQRKIASVLYNIDQAIQKTEEIIEQTKRTKKGMMQDLFTEGYYEHEEFKEKDLLGTSPSNWQIKKISEVSNIEMGSSPKSKFYNKKGKGIPFFQGNNEFGFQHPKTEVWCSNPQKEANKGDILISVRAPVADLNIASQKCCIGRGLAAITPEKINRDYLYYHLKKRQKFLKRIATGSTYDSINSKDLKNLEIKIPPKEEQKKISNILNSLNDKIIKEKKGKKELKRLKKGLMQDLLTGEVRTKDKDVEVLDEVMEVENE